MTIPLFALLVVGLCVLAGALLLRSRGAGRRVAVPAPRLLQFSLENATVAAFWIDPQGALLYANRRACVGLGYDREALLGKTIFDIDPALSLDRWRRHWQSLRESGSGRFETSHRHKDGREIAVEVSANYIEHGGRAYACAFARDVTARKRVEAELQAAKEMVQLAKSANDAKSLFLANVSHELRTPLTSIIGFSEILLDERMGPLGAPAYREYAESIRDSGNDLLGLINDTLDISKIEARRMELHQNEEELGHIVGACLRLVGHGAQEAGIGIVNQIPENLPRLFVDVRALKQVLLNLLSNAIKFTPEGGSITLSAGLGAKGELWLSVQDTGIGIAAQHQALVFEPFEQVENVASRRYRGTGLGLPISKKLVQLHGGDMLLESALGEGTKVTLILPEDRVFGGPLARVPGTGAWPVDPEARVNEL